MRKTHSSRGDRPRPRGRGRVRGRKRVGLPAGAPNQGDPGGWPTRPKTETGSVNVWWVYVLQSRAPRPRNLPGFHYVGCTTDPCRRIRQHNGEITGGGRYTSKHRPKSSALKAEYALKHGKRGTGRTQWSPEDSIWCRGRGPDDDWVNDPTKPPVWD
jgi:predicted GIY-YIG superfamily endonuclease